MQKTTIHRSLTVGALGLSVGLLGAAGNFIISKPVQAIINPSMITRQAVSMADYRVRYLDGSKEVFSITKQAPIGTTVEVVADDLFNRGYELFDKNSKSLTVTNEQSEVIFQVGPARELMSLTEFLRHPVKYDYPLNYRKLDFTGRQGALEDFVIKKIYQGDKNTGVFYGTKNQADQIRKTLLNGSFQGAYARYVTNIVPALPKQIDGDKYEHSISFTYQEHRENMILGEQKVTEFVERYGTDYTDAEKAKLIHDWLIKNAKPFIPPHNGQEWFYNSKKNLRVHFPASLLLDGEGVCLTYAMTYGRLAERMGLEVRLIQGYIGMGGIKDADAAMRAAKAWEMFSNSDSTTYHPGYLNHTWNLVKIDRAWHHVDTFQDVGFINFTKHDPNPHRYFLQDQDYMSQSRIKMGRRGRMQEYIVYRAWNKNRIFDAPSAKNEFRVMRDRSRQDFQF